jgi:hypothetical protein
VTEFKKNPGKLERAKHFTLSKDKAIVSTIEFSSQHEKSYILGGLVISDKEGTLPLCLDCT